jgi:glycosyltransferase involved in cell wall biosynthesis
MTRPYLLDGRALQDRSSTRGIGTYLRGLLDGFATAGVDDEVSLLLRAGQPLPDDLGRWRAEPGPRLPVLKRRLQPVADPFLVSRVLRSARPHVYHAVEYAQPIAPPRGTRVVVTVHDLIPFLFPADYPWMRRERLLALRLLRRADAVITPSAATAADTARLAQVDPARITVVPHGVDAAYRPAPATTLAELRTHLGLGAEEPYLLSVGVFDPRKRLGLLLAAAARLCREHPALRLVIAGDQGDYTGPVRAAVEAAGLADRTVLCGYVPSAWMPALYTGATCLLFTSAYEGFGLPVLEAMARGIPVVTSRRPALNEIFGVGALLVEPGDEDAVASAIDRVLREERLRADLVRRGQALAASFSWAETARRTRRALAGAARRR